MCRLQPDTCLMSAKILKQQTQITFIIHREDEQPRRGRKDTIMTDRFLELCARECAAYVQRMFDHAPRIPGTGMATIPVIGGPFLLGMEVPDCLYWRVCMALGAREQFACEVSGWPALPLHKDDIEAMKNDDNPRHNLLGLFADSLGFMEWDYERHPRFNVFAAGLLAYPSTPDEIRNDSSLLQEFPPRRLKGLCDGWLVWRSPTTINFDREMAARNAAYEARMGW